MQQEPKPILVDSIEASKLLSIRPRTLQELTRRGEIPSVKIGSLRRYRLESLEQWLRDKEAGR